MKVTPLVGYVNSMYFTDDFVLQSQVIIGGRWRNASRRGKDYISRIAFRKHLNNSSSACEIISYARYIKCTHREREKWLFRVDDWTYCCVSQKRQNPCLSRQRVRNSISLTKNPPMIRYLTWIRIAKLPLKACCKFISISSLTLSSSSVHCIVAFRSYWRIILGLRLSHSRENSLRGILMMHKMYRILIWLRKKKSSRFLKIEDSSIVCSIWNSKTWRVNSKKQKGLKNMNM